MAARGGPSKHMATRSSAEKTTSERPRPLRSARWFGQDDLAGFIHRAAVHAEGISRSASPAAPLSGSRTRERQPPLPLARRGGEAGRLARGRPAARVPDHLAQREPDEADDDALPEPD